MINWNVLAQAPNPGQAFMDSFNQARQMKQREELMRQQQQEHREDRQFRREEMTFRRDERATEQRAKQLQQAREQLQIMSRLLDGVTDPMTYEQARQNAVALGLDVSKVPPQFDPNWVAQSKRQAQALMGAVDRELMAVSPGTTVIDERTGGVVFSNPRAPRYIPVQPGGKLVLDPSSVGGGTPPMVGDDEWEIIEEGRGGNAPGGF